MNVEGWGRFTMHSHTQLWKKLDAKNPAKGYGAIVADKNWYWYENRVNQVREECQQHPNFYRSVEPPSLPNQG